MGGLNADDEATFLSAVGPGKAAARLAWARCEPAIKKGGEARYPGQDDPFVASIIVRVPHDESASCVIEIEWSSKHHWSMNSTQGLGADG